MLHIAPKWFAVLAVQFLFLIYILNKILFKPLLEIFEERDNSVKGSLDAAKEMDEKKEEGIATLNREISGARNRAREVFEAKRTEGLDRQKEGLSEAESSAGDMLQKAREELRGEVAKAREQLKADVDKFSDEIVRKLVKA